MKHLVWLFALIAIPLSASTDLSPDEYVRICKGMISAGFLKPIDSIEVLKEEDGVVYLAYTRTRDETRWTYRCKISGSSIIWASESGRWRTLKYDEKITFQIDRKAGTFTIYQLYSDGSKKEDTFPLEE